MSKSTTAFGDLLLATVLPFKKRATPPPRPVPQDPPIRPAAVLNERLAKSVQALSRARRDAAHKALVDAHRARYVSALDKQADRIADLQKREEELRLRFRVA